MSDWGEALGTFIKGLYWAVGIMAVTILALIGVIIWMVVK